MLMCRGYSF